MKKTLVILFVAGVLAACKSTDSNKSDYQYKDVPFTTVHFSDDFWAPRIETIRSVTVPFAFHKCEETHRIDNFAVAGKLMEGKFNSPYPFDDSDVYKIMEGAALLYNCKLFISLFAISNCFVLIILNKLTKKYAIKQAILSKITECGSILL